ncbi:MAG: UDP-N-acetylmuramoyl-tripeptide--D-alanyl-D-alanine ligase [Chlamydiae bacterium]|nr:UDP-N-acetylmuramoyl-tripeptide--D-alanyl-D-alanine ligase [Chlamydiota bacterium]
MKGYSFKQFAEFFHVKTKQSYPIQGFSIDSRQVKPGEVFFAIKGNRVDGHQFIKEVAEKKAVGAVVSQDYKGENFGLELIFVPNVQDALQSLAKEILSKRREKIIAITGTTGKTTTKEFLSTLLEKKYRVAKTFSNSNSQLTFPLRILNLEKEDLDLLVLEMGMSMEGEILKLISIAPPDIALITKISLVHAKSFPEGIDGIARAKSEIFSLPVTKFVFLNKQALIFYPDLISEKKVFTYSINDADADYYLVKEEKGFRVKENGATSPLFFPPFPQTHLLENFLGGAAICRHLGMSWEEIFFEMQKLKPFYLRFETIYQSGVTYIQDCYNSNPESLRAALMNLPAPQKKWGKKIAALGSMTGFGKFSEQCHISMAKEALNYVDELLCIGLESLPMVEIFKNANRPAAFYSSLEEMKKELFRKVSEGDVVLIKGSNDHQMWKILET